jgi:hypothetical protein
MVGYCMIATCKQTESQKIIVLNLVGITLYSSDLKTSQMEFGDQRLL